MKDQEVGAEWFQLLGSRQQLFIAPALEKSVTYLRNARLPGEGWGPYYRIGSDLHHSALAVQALFSSGDLSSIGLIADVASHFRKTTTSTLEHLTFNDLCNLLLITKCEEKPLDDVYTQKLLSSLQHSYERFIESGKGVQVRILAHGLLTLAELNKKDIHIAGRLADHLLELQCADGGWPAVAGEQSSVVVSAIALRALSRLTKNQAKEASFRGLNYLRSQLESTGWQNLGLTRDTFSQAAVLLALAELSLDYYELIREGVDALTGNRNEDGSWGGGPKETGNIEVTSLSLLALVAAGENRFVPTSLARAALTGLKNQLSEVTAERNNLRMDFEKKILVECGKVVKERNELLKENEALQLKSRRSKSRRSLEVHLSDREFTLPEEADLPYRQTELEQSYAKKRNMRTARLIYEILTPRNILEVLILSALIYMLFEKKEVLNSFWQLAGALLALIALLIVIFIYDRRTINKDLDAIYPFENMSLTPELTRLRSRYHEISENWPFSVREELAYRLFTELVTMPPEIGIRYSEDLASRLGLASRERREFLLWVSRAMRLSGRDRRVLFSQLQKVYLK